MSVETKDSTWERTKSWSQKNPTIAGALAGGTAGMVIPGVGTLIGVIVGAGIGFAAGKKVRDDLATPSTDPSLGYHSEWTESPSMSEEALTDTDAAGEVERRRSASSRRRPPLVVS
jgi:hypothetical protein